MLAPLNLGLQRPFGSPYSNPNRMEKVTVGTYEIIKRKKA